MIDADAPQQNVQPQGATSSEKQAGNTILLDNAARKTGMEYQQILIAVSFE